MVHTKALVVVGPKLVRISQQDAAKLRSSINSNDDLAFLVNVVSNLETLWPAITETLPQLVDTHGDEALESLRRFFKGEEDALISGERYNNIVLDVMTVLSQVVDVWRLATTQIDNSVFGPPISPSHHLDDIQGFCLGFLTAAAVASAKDKTAFEHNAAAALGLAVCIGALVEADAVQLERLEDHAAFLSVAWSSQAEYDILSEILGGETDPERGYIACITDQARATVTIPRRNASDIQRRLENLGLSVQAVPHLQGRYHNASVYARSAGRIKELSRRDVRFQLPSGADLVLPLRSNIHGELIKDGPLHEIALDSILIQRCQWFETVHKATTQSVIQEKDIFQAGASAAVPRSLRSRPLVQNEEATAVAVIGMGCRFPDADSLEEFWELLSEGKSAARTLPTDRFSPSDVTREPKVGYHGNFLRHPDHFDHRFFGMSGREAKNLDPQQRLVLQVAYETLESSGYFGVNATPSTGDRDIGCYVGVVAVDYEHNVASHDATAFSALGTLRAFVSGRISHYFGWSGPSVVFDTACSSSAVAIHSAVQAIKSGECSMALAGGVNVLTSPAMWQNLAAGSFLSPTGASRAFDAGANGYCRGEGAGLVLLKSLKQARADGDSILAVIAGSAVNQGSNCTPITVPASQSDLYIKALSVAGINAKDVSYVEAHGTGTPVGDPIECQSIRKTFGGPDRAHELLLGSVKDNIGHCEAASGVAALIKIILMMQKRTVPKQANFKQLNPKIAALEPDRMAIPVWTQPWTIPKPIAVVNNYGAAGSNAALVVQHNHSHQHHPVSAIANNSSWDSAPLPFIISAKTRESLQEYCTVLKAALPRIQESHGTAATAALAYNLSVKQSRGFEHVYSFTASSLSEVVAALDHSTESSQVGRTQHRPIVLCIGGQNGRTVHLDEALFRSSKLLQKHLGDCERACQALHLPSLFPTIFSPEPVEDLVSLHSLLFALQYSSAKAWLDCGLAVDTIVGHSFGQLTALAVAGALSLLDALRFISSRARLIQTFWGQETGAMLAVQGDQKTVDDLIQRSKSHYPALAVEVACYNGPQAIVLAGNGASIDALEEMAEVEEFRKLRVTRLKNTHAFHSGLVDSILPGLREVAATLDFRPPSIRIEACAEGQDWNKAIDPEMLAQHSRMPVYFGDAVQRIATRLGRCTFLEAGSASPIVPMARRALSGASSSGDADSEHIFQPIDLGPPNSVAKLAKAVSSLWIAGVDVQFWPFHRIQKESFPWINLPPYQFQKNSHWIDYVAPKTVVVVADPASTLAAPAVQQQLVELHERGAQGSATFLINTTHAMFKHCVEGHAVLGQSLCPASMYVEMAIRALGLLRDGAVQASSGAPSVKDLQISSPLSMGAGRFVFLQLEPVGGSEELAFTVLSRTKPGATASIKHASGVLTLAADASRMQLVRRIAGQQARYDELAKSSSSHVLNGAIVYQVFSQVVDYAPYYKGVTQVVSKGNEALAKVQMPAHQSPAFMDEAICDPITLDNFLQVAGIHVNCLSERTASEVFVCTELGEMLLTDGFLASRRRETQSYKVYSSSIRTGTAKSIVNDILIFDGETDDLIVLFSGAIFQSVSIKSLARTLAKLNGDVGSIETQQQPRPTAPSVVAPKPQPTPKTNEIPAATNYVEPAKSNVLSRVRELFSHVIEMPIDEVAPTASLEELGVDSLMSTEILNEIKKRFDVTISAEDFLTLTDVQSVAQLLGGGRDEAPSAAAEQHTPDVQTSTSGHGGLASSFAQIQMLLAQLLEVPADEIAADTSLADLGIDSLMATEVLNEIKTQFGVIIQAEELAETPDVLALATRLQSSSSTPTPGTLTPPTPAAARTPALFVPDTRQDEILKSVANGISAIVESSTPVVTIAHESFVKVRGDFDAISRDVGFAGFYSAVYPAQMELVVRYIVEAFANMDCPLAVLAAGDMVPDVKVLAQHDKLKRQLYQALEDANIVKQDTAGRFVRTAVPVPQTPSELLLQAILANFPQHAFEHNLLASTGSKLGECLTGKTDPLAVLFGSAPARTLMGNVYANGPMFKAITINLARYLVKLFESFPESRPIRILEVGAGTGGTTMHLVEKLVETHKKFEYTFADLSSSLVAAAKRKFAKRDFMRYAVLNIEEEPAPQFLHQYDIVISTNCIHATSNLTATCANINKCLRPDGVVCLVEATRNLYWYDLVWGLVDGWWLFSDGRQHALANEDLWRDHLSQAGFRWIDWTASSSDESTVMRIITASPTKVAGASEPVTMETVTFKQEGSLSLQADIYYPKQLSEDTRSRPVALMIHGGGHVMLSRKDVRPPQTETLLAAGFLPVSVDYRLAPEMTLVDGPMKDVCDALAWARHQLPQLSLRRRDIRADGTKVVAVGWSTGGHLALTLGFTAPARGLRAPDATLAFYCPYDYEDPFWAQPNLPFGQDPRAQLGAYNLLEGVRDGPITAYNPPPSKRALGGWMSPSDPRSRIVLHMNWTGRCLRVLLNGLSQLSRGGQSSVDPTDELPDPSPEQIQAVSPLAQIRRGKYKVPTFIIHGTADDLIPWEQAARTHEALKQVGVDAEIRILDGALHLFDLFRSYENDERAKTAVRDGYAFLGRHVVA